MKNKPINQDASFSRLDTSLFDFVYDVDIFTDIDLYDEYIGDLFDGEEVQVSGAFVNDLSIYSPNILLRSRICFLQDKTVSLVNILNII
ncbi:hypothetical protein DB313_05520 (plasmid) [Borrelia turcica IST7]|uniref:Uncharacterized protein n=1 Tax=Borrelia turcica IST7 TaxID=1104446 RepID=A0A386PN75_9SPIR|nr:hypothetical protein [Borrelia turcica]AYE36956.1 hypothetical protein DB313_05520 [Borrelia turcica IST7]